MDNKAWATPSELAVYIPLTETTAPAPVRLVGVICETPEAYIDDIAAAVANPHAAGRAGALFYSMSCGGEVNPPLAPPDFRRKATLSLT